MRGVNFGGWFSQVDAIQENDPERFVDLPSHLGTFLGTADFPQVKEERSADRELLDHCLRGEFVYILTARQDFITAGRKPRIRNADGSKWTFLDAHEDQPVTAAAWSPDGKRGFAADSGDSHGTARSWNADGSGKPVILQGPVRAAAWSPNSERILIARTDDTAHIWEANGSGKPIVLRGHDRSRSGVIAADWSPDKTVEVWNAADGSLDTVLRGHEDQVFSVAFNHDGSRVLTTSKKARSEDGLPDQLGAWGTSARKGRRRLPDSA